MKKIVPDGSTAAEFLLVHWLEASPSQRSHPHNEAMPAQATAEAAAGAADSRTAAGKMG